MRWNKYSAVNREIAREVGDPTGTILLMIRAEIDRRLSERKAEEDSKVTD